MLRYSSALLCALLVLSELNPILAKRSFGSSGGRHSYPKSGGLSGSGGSHSYPHSGGLSGSGGSHSYPHSGGLSGSSSHGYPSSGGLSGGGSTAHRSPSSGSGYPSSGGSHAYPSNKPNEGSQGYPPSGGLSGSGSGYPHNTNTHSYPTGRGVSGTNYQYKPPQQITYTPVHGGPPVHYPVYHGAPPTYVYQYKDSGSKYGTLLAGLALFNLGALAGGVYSHSTSHSNNNYKPQPGEVCKLGIKKDNGDYEETRINCQLITSFILEDQAKQNQPTNTTVITTTTTNVTVVNSTNVAPDASTTVPPAVNNTLYMMLPNGTLVPVNATNGQVNSTATSEAPPSNNTGTNETSSVITTTTTTNTTVTNALDVKGAPIDVTPGMKCYVIRNSPTSNMRKSIPCGVLQTYAQTSIQKAKPNSGSRSIPALSIIAIAFTVFITS